MHKSMIVLAGIMMVSAASAKLPPLSDEAKAKAEEEKNKVAWTDKIAAYKLCLAQDRVAAYYRKTKNAKATTATTAPPNAGAGATAAPSATPPVTGNAANASSAAAPAAMPAPAAASGPAPSASATPASSDAATPPVASAAPVVIPSCQDPGPYAGTQSNSAKVGVADSLPVPAAGKPPSAGETKK